MDDIGGYDESAFVADFYDGVVLYAERSDIKYYVRESQNRSGSVLELGSGTGRVVLPMARAGLSVVGLDGSPHMLRTCRARLESEPNDVRARVQLIQGDMRKFGLNEVFPTITLPFNTFLHLQNVSEQLATLANVRRHLAKDGNFLFDIFNPAWRFLTDDRYLEEFGHEPERILPGGRRFVRCQRIVERNLPNQTIDSEIIYYVTDLEGREERMVHKFRLRFLFRFELEHLLDRAGLRLVSLFGDFEGNPFQRGHDGLLVVTAAST